MTQEARGELTRSTEPHGDPALRARMDTDGYLFLPGLLPAAAVRRVRTEILTICAAAGWLAPGREPDGTVNPAAACEPPDPRYYQVYRRVISLESYNRLAHAEQLLRLTAVLLGHDDVIPRPARLARLVFPQPDLGATPPHQDYPHEQGTAEAYTAWVPLGAIPRSRGGLAVWAGSHRRGLFDHGFVPGTGGLGIRTETMNPPWLTADFEAGDVVMFHSLTVHKALPNRTDDQIRLSADFRYQRAADPMAPHMLEPSGNGLTWEEVYAGWSSDELKYYWADAGVTLVPYDQGFYRRRDAEAIEQARAGDRHALAFLRTISARSRDEALRRAASEVLAAKPAAQEADGDGRR